MVGIINELHGRPVLINGTRDHVHLLFVLPAHLSLSDCMEKLKANSSKWVNDHSARRIFFWQAGYTAFGVSQSKLNDVKGYIATQEEHHGKSTYQEEVMAPLQKHGVDFDPRFVV
jgi:putative transposase